MVGMVEYARIRSLWPFSPKSGAAAPLGRETFGQVLDGCGCFAEAGDAQASAPSASDISVEVNR